MSHPLRSAGAAVRGGWEAARRGAARRQRTRMRSVSAALLQRSSWLAQAARHRASVAQVGYRPLSDGRHGGRGGRGGRKGGGARRGRGGGVSVQEEKESIANKVADLLQKLKPQRDPKAFLEATSPLTFEEGIERMRKGYARSDNNIIRKAATQHLGLTGQPKKLRSDVLLDLSLRPKHALREDFPADLLPHKDTRKRGGGGARRDRRSEDESLWGDDGAATFSPKAKGGRKAAAPRRAEAAALEVSIGDRIELQELSRQCRRPVAFLAEQLAQIGVDGDGDWNDISIVAGDDAELLCMELGWAVRRTAAEESAAAAAEPAFRRAPVVSIMGHVDHGKTTLLDALRERGGVKRNLAAGEDGGITQRLSAFAVDVPSWSVDGEQKAVTFLDTPGHAAFQAMRSSGARATDVAVVVIAIDDGVRPQTEEVLSLLVAQEVPMVVALTKCDKEGIDAKEARRAIENELVSRGVSLEAEGGDTACVPVSGITGDGVSELLEAIALRSESLDLSADPRSRCEAVVLDSGVEKGIGAVASVLIRGGTLRVGDHVVCGEVHGRVRRLLRPSGAALKSGRAAAGEAAQVVGLPSAPDAGSKLVGVKNERQGAMLAERRRAVREASMLSDAQDIAGVAAAEAAESRKAALDAMRRKPRRVNLSKQLLEEQLAEEATGGEASSAERRLAVVLKADGAGTLDALGGVVRDLADGAGAAAGGDEGGGAASMEVLSASIGPVTETDVTLAAESGAPIAAFNVSWAAPDVKRLAESRGVRLLEHKVIYHLVEALQAAFEDVISGAGEAAVGAGDIAKVIEINAKGRGVAKVAGCRIESGKFRAGAGVRYRVRRGGKIVAKDLRVETLKHFKDEVEELPAGQECGLQLSGFSDFEEGDALECYLVKQQ